MRKCDRELLKSTKALRASIKKAKKVPGIESHMGKVIIGLSEMLLKECERLIANMKKKGQI